VGGTSSKAKQFAFDVDGSTATKAAFYEQTYIDRYGVLQTFLDHINDSLNKWDTVKYHSPLVALVQASTIGKSKMLWAVAEHVYTVYVCLRNKGSSGIPPRSTISDKLCTFVDDQTALFTYVTFICSTMRHLTSFKGNKMDWFKAHTSNNQLEFWNVIGEGMKNCMDDIQNIIGDRKDYDEAEWHSIKQLVKMCWDSLKKMLDSDESESGMRLLFVFDEAKILTEIETNRDKTNFECLRHALATLPTYESGGRAFAIVTDTASKISNFAPSARRDPSWHVQKNRLTLYPPFYHIATLDTFMTQETEPKTLKQVASPQYFFHYGRPLWGGLLKATDAYTSRQVLSPEKILEIAKSKLIGGLDLEDWITKKHTEKITIPESIAVLGPRLCIDVVPQTELATELVASYMSLCYYISNTRESVMIDYPSDPVLAEASAHITNNTNRIGLAHHVCTLISALREGSVEGGYRGELVARLILTMAWDKACIEHSHTKKANMFSHPMTLQQYFQALLSSKVWQALQDKLTSELQTARIRFTHFIRVTYTPSPKQLLEFFRRGAAVICKRNQVGVDLILLLLINIDEDKEFSPEHVTYVLIQVKNYQSGKDSSYPMTATSLLSPNNAGIEEIAKKPFVALYMQLGALEASFDIPSPDHITRNIKKNLEELEQPEDLMKPRTRANMKRTLKRDHAADIGSVNLSKRSRSDATTNRIHYQTPIALFGLSSEIYGVFSDSTQVMEATSLTATVQPAPASDITELLKIMLKTWAEPRNLQSTEARKKLITRMSPQRNPGKP
ncbi:5507_t:CDS:2, partial [Paraglomus brasilianum]